VRPPFAVLRSLRVGLLSPFTPAATIQSAIVNRIECNNDSQYVIDPPENVDASNHEFIQLRDSREPYSAV
jgi:hypothetical protein